MSHRTDFWLRLIPTLVLLLSLVLQPVSLAAPVPSQSATLTGTRTAEVSSGPEARANAARLLLASPNTVVITAAGIQPDVIEVTVNTPVTFINQDTVARSIVLATGDTPPPPDPQRRVYLPLVLRAGAGATATAGTTVAQPRSPTAQETIVLSPGASVQRTFTTPGNVAVTDAANPAVQATILVTPQPLDTEGNVTGAILSFSTKLPIAGARVRAVDTSFEATADSQGRYTLPLPPGDYTLVMFANGYTFANRTISVQPFTPLTVETVELVPLEATVTAIGAAGGTATNSAGTTKVVFASGAVTTTKAVRLTVLPVDEAVGDYDALPGPFRNGEVPIGFVMFEPDGTTFTGDAVWTIDYDGPLPVGYNWEDGLYCYYWLEKEARWGEPVPAEVVDLGGGKKGLRATLPHFSAYGFAAPPPLEGGAPVQGQPYPGDPNSPYNNDNCAPSEQECGSGINFASGELTQRVGTLGLPSLGGLPTQVVAKYRSSLMHNRVEISTTLGVAPGYLPPHTSDWRFTGAGFTASGTGQDVYASFAPTPASPPGIYDGVLTARYGFRQSCPPGGSPCYPGYAYFYTDMPWPVRVTRNDLSPFGLGWFSGHDTLLINRGQWVTIVEGDSSQVNFTLDGDSYLPPTGDFSTLTHNADGAWTRAFRDGSSVRYNADGRLERITDRYGNFQLLLYESNGKTVPVGGWGLTTRIKRITDTSGNTFDYTYDANGWLSRIDDSAGRAYLLEHDAAGRLTAFTDPLGVRETFAYDARGMMTSHTDRRGAATSYVLDDQGRLLSRTWPTGSQMTLAYAGSEVTVQADNGTRTVTTLDDRFNPVMRFNGVYTATTTYNEQLQPASQTHPPSAAFYDAYGNLIETLAATNMAYERKGPFDQVSRATGSDGSDSTFTYDAAGNLKSMTDALGQTYQMTYDSHGQLLAVTDPLGRTTGMTYDDRGQITSVTDSLGRTTTMAYDDAGRLTRATNALGNAVTPEYDALNRLTATVDALNGRTTLTYDAEGNLAQIADPTGRGINYTYDALNRRTGATYADGGQETYAYDPLGNLTGFTDANGKTTVWSYDAANRPVQKTVAGGPTVTYAYDDLDQVTGVDDGTLATTVTHIPDALGYPLRKQQLAAGLPLSVTVDYAYGGAGAIPSSAPLPAAAETSAEPPVTQEPDAPASPPEALAEPSQADELVKEAVAEAETPAEAPLAPEAPVDTGPYVERRAENGPYGPDTNVGGTISVDTTWTLAGSPYVVTNYVTVQDNVTLTVEPGVTVVVNNGYSVVVNGVLKAIGTAGAPITFTSATSGDSGAWGYLQIGGGTAGDSNASQLSYVTLEGGGQGGSGTLSIYQSAPALDHITVRRSSSDGIYVSQASGGAGFTLDTATLEDNAGDGIEIAGSGGPRNTLANLTLSGNGVAARLRADTVLTNISAAGNGLDQVWWTGGTVTANLTWPKLNGAAHRVGYYLTVADGVTLTIEPGATVVMGNGYSVVVNGVLKAIGTASAPITFTSATPGDSGAWGYLQIGGGTAGDSNASQLSYVTLEGGGQGGSGTLSIYQSAPALDHITVRRSSSDGIYVSQASGGAGFTLDTATLEDNAGDGIEIAGSGGPRNTLANLTLSGNGVAARLRADTVLTNISAAGNGLDQVWWTGGTVTANLTWPKLNGAAHRVGYYLTVADGVTLTIEPGATVVMGNGYSVVVNGVLKAIGTASAPITFTSATPGDSGAWGYLQIGGGTAGDSNASQLSYVTLEGGGQGGSGTLSIYQSAPALDHITVRRSSSDGIYVSQGVGTAVTACTLAEIAGYGIRNTSPASGGISATGCYWGAASGPYHPTLNPTGQGVAVSDGVVFTPYSPAYLLPGDGRLSGIRVASNNNAAQSQHFDYDATGQLTSLSSNGYATYTLAYAYDASGRLLSRSPSAGAGLDYSYTYDAAGQVTRLAISTTQGLLLVEDYAYDAAGNLTAVSSAQGGNFSYGYDANNRLTSATGLGLNASYGYDAAGNRTAAGGVTFAYDAGGRLTGSSDGASYTYDAAGNLLSRNRSGATDTFTWDGQGRLVRIDYAAGGYSAYAYDDAGRRISKRKPDGTTIYYVYAGDMLAQELDASGAVLASYTYNGLDRPITMWRGGQTYSYLLDRLGSVRGLTDEAGNLVASYRYDPWGNLLSSSGSVANPLRFTAREYDEESGLYFYRARYYDPTAGRFISRDPARLAGDPNPYAYVANNPFAYTDPHGRGWHIVGGALLGAGIEGGLELVSQMKSGQGIDWGKVGNAAIGGAAGGAAAAALGPLGVAAKLGRYRNVASGAFGNTVGTATTGVLNCDFSWKKTALSAGLGAMGGRMVDEFGSSADELATTWRHQLQDDLLASSPQTTYLLVPGSLSLSRGGPYQ